jgi:hypothetical protein
MTVRHAGDYKPNHEDRAKYDLPNLVERPKEDDTPAVRPYTSFFCFISLLIEMEKWLRKQDQHTLCMSLSLCQPEK